MASNSGTPTRKSLGCQAIYPTLDVAKPVVRTRDVFVKWPSRGSKNHVSTHCSRSTKSQKSFATQRTQLPSISHHPRAPSHGESFTIPCCATVPTACKVGFCFAAHVCSEWLVHPNSAAEPGLVGHISALTAWSFHIIRP